MGLLSNLIYLLFEQPVPLVIAGEEADTTDKDDVDRVDAITQSLPSSDIGLSASKSQGTLKSVSSVSVTCYVHNSNHWHCPGLASTPVNFDLRT